jgi:uncharacterized membrane protein (DUF485 family)
MDSPSSDAAANNAGQPAAHDAHVSPNAELGMGMFVIYLLLYLGFMAIAVFNYELFGSVQVGPVNLAIVYGFGLIAAALVLALIYMFFCKPE